MMKLVVDSETDKVLGASMCGPDAPEIMQGLAVAVKCGATKAQFDSTVSASGTSVGCFLAGLSFYFKDHGTYMDLVPILALSGILVFVGSFSIGMGAVPWVMMAEVYNCWQRDTNTDQIWRHDPFCKASGRCRRRTTKRRSEVFASCPFLVFGRHLTCTGSLLVIYFGCN